MLEKKVFDNALNALKVMEYGENITHSNFGKLVEVKPQTQQYYCAVTKIQKQLLTYGKLLENVPKVGYCIAKPDDYSKLAIRQYKQGAKKLSNGEKILKYAPTGKMSEQGLYEYRCVHDRAIALSAYISGGIVEIKKLARSHPLLQNSTANNNIEQVRKDSN